MDLILLLLSNCANDPQTSNFSKKHLWQLISTSSLISMIAWHKMFATKFLNFESPKNYPRISNASCIKSKFESFGFLQYAACVTAIQSPTHPYFYLHFYWQHRRSRLAKKGCSTPPYTTTPGEFIRGSLNLSVKWVVLGDVTFYTHPWCTFWL